MASNKGLNSSHKIRHITQDTPFCVHTFRVLYELYSILLGTVSIGAASNKGLNKQKILYKKTYPLVFGTHINKQTTHEQTGQHKGTGRPKKAEDVIQKSSPSSLWNTHKQTGSAKQGVDNIQNSHPCLFGIHTNKQTTSEQTGQRK